MGRGHVTGLGPAPDGIGWVDKIGVGARHAVPLRGQSNSGDTFDEQTYT